MSSGVKLFFKFWIGLFLGLCGFMSSVQAESKSLCSAGTKPVKFNVAVLHQPFKLKALQSERKMIALGGTAKHLGLVKAIPKFEVKLQWEEFKFWERTCYAANLDVFMSHQPNSTIYLRDSLKPGTCLYEKVLRHEREHEADHHELLIQAADVIRLQFEKEVLSWKIEPSESTQTHQEVLNEMSKVFSRYYSENAGLNAYELDTLEEFEKCGHGFPL